MLPTEGLVERILGLGWDYIVKKYRLDLLLPFRRPSARRDGLRNDGLADVIENASHRKRFSHEGDDAHSLAAVGTGVRWNTSKMRADVLQYSLLEWPGTVTRG